jgi:dynein intermediate chain 1
MLTANNPAAPQNLARFNMKERAYKFEPMVEQHVSRRELVWRVGGGC